MSRRVQRVAVRPLTLLAMLECARAALDHGEPQLGRAVVDDAIHRLELARQAQDDVPAAWTATLETPGTTLDLSAS